MRLSRLKALWHELVVSPRYFAVLRLMAYREWELDEEFCRKCKLGVDGV